MNRAPSRPPTPASRVAGLTAAFAAWCLAGAAPAQAPPAAPPVDRTALPIEPRLAGATVGPTYRESTPATIERVRAPEGAPNVVVVLLDDVGFAAAGTFGGPVPTPALDAVAREGLRYNRFHTTALCSPSRAALLTGRNAHAVGSGQTTEFATAFDGYSSIIPASCATVAQVLRLNGYSTAAFGKWHNTPVWEVSPVGPFDRWPTGMGFEEFYGFMGGETSQFEPGLFHGTLPVERPQGPGEYHLTTDLADRAIRWMGVQRALAPDRPFFLYFAPGATHTPHQAPSEYRAKYRGKFDQGWDALREESFARQKAQGVIPPNARLTPRPAEIPAWDSLTPDQRRVAARLMEVYAGYMEHTDAQVGRLVSALKEQGQWDNTLFIYIVGDNGAAPQGGPHGVFNTVAHLNGVHEDPAVALARIDDLGGPRASNEYPVGFAWAMDTPFQWTKMFASHLGGTRNPAVISWPRRIKDAGALRGQFAHLIDVAPTIYEAAGVPAPRLVGGVDQRPLDGVSLAYSFDDPAAPSRRTTQYFEVQGSRGIYHDGWIACTFHQTNWDTNPPPPFDQDRWELYHIDGDFSQAVDLSAAQPEKLRELRALFDAEARRNAVLPLDDRKAVRAAAPGARPNLAAGRTSFTLPGGAARMPEDLIRPMLARPHGITAVIDLPEGAPGEGVITAAGGRFAGFSLYLQKGRPTFTYNYFGVQYTTIAGERPLPAGRSTIRYQFEYDGGGLGKGATLRLFVDDQEVARGRIEKSVPLGLSADETLDVGEDAGGPATDRYEGPFRFTGSIEKVTYEMR